MRIDLLIILWIEEAVMVFKTSPHLIAVLKRWDIEGVKVAGLTNIGYF
jgi:hypothetical protein